MKQLFFSLVLFFVLLSVRSIAQERDSVFPAKEYVFNENLLSENPASAGLLGRYGFHISGKVLNPEMREYPYNGIVSLDASPMKKSPWGIGAEYNYFRFSSRDVKTGTLAFSGIKKLKSLNIRIRAGISLSYFQYANDYKNAYTYGDMIDPGYGFVYNTSEMAEFYKDTSEYTGFSANAGTWIYGKDFLFGISVCNFISSVSGDSMKTENEPDYFPTPVLREYFACSVLLSSDLSLLPGIEMQAGEHGFRVVPSAALNWKKFAMLRISYASYRMVHSEIGIYLKDHFVFNTSIDLCTDQVVRETIGISGVQAGIRIIY